MRPASQVPDYSGILLRTSQAPPCPSPTIHRSHPRSDGPALAHKIGEVYSLTWSFSGPDGRALFLIGPDTDGEPVLTWLAVGYHDIYQ